MTERRKRLGGFSLLEVLVALAITALFMHAMLPAAASNLDRLDDLRRRSGALLLARATLERHLLIAEHDEGSFDGQTAAFKWSARIERLRPAPDEPNALLALRRVSVSVSDAADHPLVTLSAYRVGALQ